MTSWITAETLAADAITVASVGGAPRDFAALQRVVQRQLAKTPALYDGVTTAVIVEAVGFAQRRGEDMELTVPTRSGPHRLRIRPVLGPAGDIHAVRLWLGPAASPCAVPGPAVGAIWDLATQTLAVPSGIIELAGVSAEEFVPRMSIAQLFQRLPDFHRHVEVLDLLFDPTPGAKLQFDATVTDGAGHRGRWRITIRARDDERGPGAWWLIEDVTTEQDAAHGPPLECIGLREAHRRAGNCLAVVELEHGGIVHWLTDPAPWVRWDYLFRPGDVFHPQDRGKLRELRERVRAGETAGATVRTLGYSGGHEPTSLLLYPYPGYSSRSLAIGQFIRAVENFPQFAPIAPDAEESNGGAPIGYDQQLRHRLLSARSRRGATR
ncbi:GAF domain-containing protein [Nocardia sp. NPDC003693]